MKQSSQGARRSLKGGSAGFFSLLAATMAVQLTPQQRQLKSAARFHKSYEKGRRDGFFRKLWGPTGNSKPHQGAQECARRIRQGLNGTRYVHGDQYGWQI